MYARSYFVLHKICRSLLQCDLICSTFPHNNFIKHYTTGGWITAWKQNVIFSKLHGTRSHSSHSACGISEKQMATTYYLSVPRLKDHSLKSATAPSRNYSVQISARTVAFYCNFSAIHKHLTTLLIVFVLKNLPF